MNLADLEVSRRVLAAAAGLCSLPYQPGLTNQPFLASRFYLSCVHFVEATQSTPALRAAIDRMLKSWTLRCAEWKKEYDKHLRRCNQKALQMGPLQNAADDGRDLSALPTLNEQEDPLQYFTWEHAWAKPFCDVVVDWLGERTAGDRLNRRWFVPLKHENERLLKEMEVLARSTPASAFLWLRQLAEALNPRPNTQAHIMAEASIGTLSAVQFVVFARGTLKEQQIRSLRTVHELALDAVAMVRHELDFHLGQRQTLSWALQRYAIRSRWYNAGRLRLAADAAIDQQRAAEVELSRDACQYLFDLGFDAVWRELSVGSSRYDIVGSLGQESLLVEAKVLREDSSKADVVRAASQLRQYASQHIFEGVLVQPVLLFYRLSGPAWVLPPFVAHEILPLTIQYVDIGLAKDSGSRVRESIEVTIEELRATKERRGTVGASSKPKKVSGGKE